VNEAGCARGSRPLQLLRLTRDADKPLQPGTIPSMHDVWAAADPVDDKHAGSGTRPQFKRQSLLQIMVLHAPRGRTRDDDLQIANLEKSRLDMLFNSLKCRIHHGPQRMHEKLLQAGGQNTRRPDRWRQGSRSVRPRRAML
jgi:hypothetical protein